MQYLVQCRLEGVFAAKVLSISELAHLIGFSDLYDLKDVTVYRLLPNKSPELLYYSKANCIVWLEDRYGNPVDHHEYPEH